jgi:CheY-like chemotaxis protein
MARVLVVDDDLTVRQVARAVLELDGHHVVGRDRSHAVPAAVAAHQPDVILLDMMMPERDGEQVLADLELAGCRVPIIVLTAYPTRPNLEADPRVAAVLEKSLGIAGLADVVARVAAAGRW